MIQSVAQEKTVVIGLGELYATTDADTVLVCLGLGSCVALCVYDPVSKVGGMAHMVLPDSTEGRETEHNAKFVDTGVRRLLDRMEELGAVSSRLIVKIAGGAHMFTSQGLNGRLNIGERNTEAVKAILADLGLRLRGDDTGGNHGRTMRLSVGSGRLLVSTVGGASHEL